MRSKTRRCLGTGLLACLALTCVEEAENAKMQRTVSDALAFWNMADPQDAASKLPLKVHGDVQLGVALEGDEREDSLARGGNGQVARFDGGYLALADDAALGINPGQWAIAIRMRDPAGTWRYPILGSYGSDKQVSIALHAVDGAEKPMMERNYTGDQVSTIYSWIFKPGGPRWVPQTTSLLELVWGARKPNAGRVDRINRLQPKEVQPNPLQQDVLNAVMKPCFPVGLVGPTDWHDIVVTMAEPKLELWIDGVLVDEEYPVGTTRDRTLPFLIGAGHENGALKTGFKGLIDHVGIWGRALTSAEIASLAGGPAHVRRRALAILGDEDPHVQYFRPRGHNRKAGDCIPYWDAQTDTFRLFYLILRRNMHSKWDGGHGGLEIWQTSTKDLKTWQHHPVTVPISEQWEAWNGTGGVAFHDGAYHWFYPCPDYNTGKGGIQLATSADGATFQKSDKHPFLQGGDCEVYEDANGLFHLLRHGPMRRAKTPVLNDKTLVAWVRLADLEQRGGSVLTIEHPDGRQFDGVVFGETTPRRWMPGSDNLKRTPPSPVQARWPEEAAKPDDLVQIAIAYAGKKVTLFRNGELYAACDIRKPVVFPTGSNVIIGLRHTGASPRNSLIKGSILDARIYGRALSAAEIAQLRPGAEGGPKPVVWFDFANSGVEDRMGAVPDGILAGEAKVSDGALRLAGGHLKAPGSISTLARLTSPDLENWTPVEEPFIETDVRNVAMCPNLFKFGDWYYFIGGTQWFRSRNEFGPWQKHQPARLCGLGVPKTAAFGENRRIYAGFLGDGGWGGNAVLRELVRDEDGWLGTKFVPEMIPACGNDLPVPKSSVTLTSEDGVRAESLIPNAPYDCRIRVEVVPAPDVTRVGLVLRDDGRGGGCELLCDLERKTVSFSTNTDSAGRAGSGPTLHGIRRFDRPFTLDIVCRHDIVDAEIAAFRATCTRHWNPDGDGVRLFAEGGSATFRNIRVQPIVEPYEPYPGWLEAQAKALKDTPPSEP